MGLQDYEIEKVGNNLSRRECYERIYDWASKTGKLILEYDLASTFFNETETHNIINSKGIWFNLEFLKNIPEPNKITDDLLDYIISQIIYGKLEWAYHQRDQYGNKIGAYAHKMALINDPEKGWQSINETRFNATKLYKIFGLHHENMEKYFLNLKKTN